MLKLRVRRVGNSLGIIVPKTVLDAWGVREGEALELTARSIRPPRRLTSTHDALDELKRSLAMAVVSAFTANQIRAQGLANLHRWRAMGSWVSAYDEWQTILESAGDGELFATMLGRDERANQLRQSPPYVGLLSREEVRRLNEEASVCADPVDEGTATLPAGWKGRLVNLPPGETEGVVGLCLDPHDLAISKYVAAREKDRVFNREIVARGIVDKERLLTLLERTRLSAAVRERVQADIERDFALRARPIDDGADERRRTDRRERKK